ncbi:MAG: zf-HC2 domain-containing protein [bacterium]
MMLEEDGVHPDEGTIHAWLDGALSASESSHVEAHVATCAPCASRVAEARGLIAGAARVVGLLDEHPAPIMTPASTPTVGTDLSLWRLLRVTPARASIAAVLVVAVGIALTSSQLNKDASRTAPGATADSSAADALRATVPMAAAPAATPPPARDTLLNSAIARRIAQEQPARALAPAAGVVVPAAPAQTTVASIGDSNASARVGAARASLSAQRDSARVRPDRTFGVLNEVVTTSVGDASQRVNTAAKAAESAGAPAGFVAGAMARTDGIRGGECYVVESTAPASWGSVRLPMLVAMDSAGTEARVLTPTGGETEARAFLERNGADSAFFRLKRIGYAGTMTLTSTGAVRSGTIRSSGADAVAKRMTARDELRGAISASVTARKVSCPIP